ncbi:MAG: HEAT repeat domain-containing protein [Phycisphaerales bacterium JB038]
MLHSGKILLLALGVALALAAPARGQTISTELFAKQNLTAEDQQQIETFALANLDRLQTGDASARRTSRRALLTPLQSPATSATFRLAYSRLTVPPLERLSQSDEVDVATSAILVLGWMATDDAVDVLLTHLRSEKETARYGAASGLRRTFILSTSAQSAAPAATVWKAVRRMTAALPTESSPYVVRAMVSALIASPRETAGVELAEALNARLSLPLAEDAVTNPNMHFLVDAYIAAAFDLRNDLIQPDQNNQDLLDATVELGPGTWSGAFACTRWTRKGGWN